MPQAPPLELALGRCGCHEFHTRVDPAVVEDICVIVKLNWVLSRPGLFVNAAEGYSGHFSQTHHPPAIGDLLVRLGTDSQPVPPTGDSQSGQRDVSTLTMLFRLGVRDSVVVDRCLKIRPRASLGPSDSIRPGWHQLTDQRSPGPSGKTRRASCCHAETRRALAWGFGTGSPFSRSISTW